MSDWLEVLREQVATSSQSRVALELGVSKTMISQVLGGKYPAEPADLRRKVEGHYMDRTVECPVLGIIPIHECEAHQQRPFSATNPQRVRLYRACRAGCPNSNLETTAKAQRQAVQQSDTGLRPYQTDDQIAFCRRMAGDSDRKNVELLERELSRIATQYNLLLWQMQHKESK
uniref:hypothetical protein n=1 Tax=Marinobacterium profundum TaxID=1714300 RepID=UPI000AA6CBC2|nr:hypothetical protein [Marinobacterium profundum]